VANAISDSQNSTHQKTQLPKHQIGNNLLLEYLRNILHCEAERIALESTLQENSEHIAKLCPGGTLPKEPKAPIQVLKEVSSKQGRFIMAIIPISAVVVLNILTSGYFEAFVGLAILFSIYQLTFGINRDKKQAQKLFESQNQTYEINLVKYKHELERYQEQRRNEQLRLNHETAQKQLYENQSERVNELLSKVKDTLSTLYGLNVLHEKYQNLEAVASIYDCISTGRTSNLSRSDNDPGAYNIYEDDVRAGKIVNVVRMIGTQIMNAINDLSSSLRTYNQSICDAISHASEMQRAATAQVIEGINVIGEQAKMSRYNDEVRNTHLEKISEYQRIQTNALRDFDTIAGHQVFDKSGRPVY